MVSPTPPDEFYFEIARAYQQAELELLGQIKNRLLKGEYLDELDWQTARLAEIQQVRKEAVSTLAKVNSSMTSKINGAFGAAYKGGEWAALKDASGFLPEKPTAVSSAARQASVRAAANAMHGGMATTMPKLLRQLEDDYARVVNQTVLRVQAGSGDRRSQTGKALEQLFGMGIKTGPNGKMNLPDYVTMAMRTGVAQTSIAGHMDTLGANGLDLVFIQPGPRHCDLCYEWSNKPLWRTTGASGQQYVDDLANVGKQYRVMVWGTLDDARAGGWGHPNCRCNVGAFIPGATVLPKPRPKWDEDGYEAQQRQRVIERHIRTWKVRGALATTAGDVAKANAKVAAWQGAIRALLKEHPELKRQARRESASGTYGPGMPWEGPVVPPKAPKPPKAPSEPAPTPAPAGQSFDAWVAAMEKSKGDLLKDPNGTINELKNAAKTGDKSALEWLHKQGYLSDAQFKAASKAFDLSHGGPVKATQVPKTPTPEAPEAPSAKSKHQDPTPTPPGSWKGAGKPTSPKEPPVPQGPDVTPELAAWLKKVEAKYTAFAPGKTIQKSNNWSYVQKAMDGDLQAADYLYQNKYLDFGLTDELHKIIAKKSQPNPRDVDAYKTAMAKYGNDLAQYKLDLAQWMADNGITSAAKGLTGTRHTNAQGIEWAHKSGVPQVMNPSAAHSAASLYSGSAYGPWNARLRAEAPNGTPLRTGQYSKNTRDLDAAMGPIPDDVILHRGTTFEEFGLGYMPPPAPGSLVGKTYTNDAYASTSVGEYAHFRSKPVQLEIMAPAGTKGANLMRSSNFGTGEREFLLARGTRYFIHSIEEFSNGHGGKWRVRVEIVPDGEDSSVWVPIP